MSLEYHDLGDTVYFHFASNDTSGSGADGATPLCNVRLCGAAADAAPVYSPTPVLLSHATYTAGSHEVAIAATEGNGFAAGNTYEVFCSLAVDGQNPNGAVGKFKLDRQQVHTVEITDGILKNASFNADVGSTAYATNIIALAADKAILNYDAPTKTEMDALETHGDGAWATAVGFNVVVPDAAGVVATALGLLETHGDSAWATAVGFNVVVPDVAGTAEALHATTDALVGGLVDQATFLVNVAEGDMVVTAGTPYTLTVKEKDTENVLVGPKSLYTVAGVAVTAVTDIVGRELETPL